MNQANIPSVTKERTPWRSTMQLRTQNGAKASLCRHTMGLGYAAQRVAPIALPDFWQRQEAKRRLVVVCNWLEKRLSKPVRIRRLNGNARRIEVFESLTYTIRPQEKHIVSGELHDGHNVLTDYNFEVGCPLITSNWMRPVLKHLGLYQGDLFFEEWVVDEVNLWIADTAYRLLLREPDFQNLRRMTLPQAFSLPSDIYGIALASRTHPVGPLLKSQMLNLVWWNLRAFRLVARENPQLLPLLLAYVQQIPPGTNVNCKDPVAALKSALLEAGLSEAAWRYAARHGARLFRIPWAISADVPPFAVVKMYLHALDVAGLPPPPPPMVIKALLHGYNQNDGNRVHLQYDFHKDINPLAMRAGLLEADKRRHDADMASFVEKFIGVCRWSEDLSIHLDKNQIKRGWSWLVSQWEKHEEVQTLLAESENRFWHTRLDQFQLGQWLVIPIDSSLELIRESMAMRNCLTNYRNDCEDGRIEIYSIRDATTGKRRGCIGFVFNGGVLEVLDIKGFANTPPRSEVKQIGRELFQRLQDLPHTQRRCLYIP